MKQLVIIPHNLPSRCAGGCFERRTKCWRWTWRQFRQLDMAARVHPIEGNNEDESLSLSSESEVPPPAAKRTRGQLDATNANRRKVISGNVLRIPIILLFAASSPDVKISRPPRVICDCVWKVFRCAYPRGIDQGHCRQASIRSITPTSKFMTRRCELVLTARSAVSFRS